MKFFAAIFAGILVPAFFTIAGCGAKPKPEALPASSHSHNHVAPHGGKLVVLGDEDAHLEFVFDASLGKMTAYVFDAHAENAVRVAQPEFSLEIRVEDAEKPLLLKMKAVGNELTGETVRDTSQFEGTDPALVGRKRFQVATGEIDVRGERYRTQFEITAE